MAVYFNYQYQSSSGLYRAVVKENNVTHAAHVMIVILNAPRVCHADVITLSISAFESPGLITCWDCEEQRVKVRRAK